MIEQEQKEAEFYRYVANGNLSALNFLAVWHDYCHEVDDIIDTPDWSNERVIRCFLLAKNLCVHPYYRAHFKALSPLVLTATSTFADSVKWEKKEQPLWKRRFAEVTRHSGNEIINYVALQCGGVDHMRGVSAPMMAMCYIYHSDKYGTPGEQ